MLGAYVPSDEFAHRSNLNLIWAERASNADSATEESVVPRAITSRLRRARKSAMLSENLTQGARLRVKQDTRGAVKALPSVVVSAL